MKKKLIYLIATAVGILLAFCGIVGCSKTAPDGGTGVGGTDGRKYDSVDIDSITVTESTESFLLLWDEVEGANEYELKCGSNVVTTPVSAINLRLPSNNFVFPKNGVLEITFTAKGLFRADSDPTKFTYHAEGTQLRSPTITKYENGILEWEADGNAVDYTVNVDGAAAYRPDSTARTYDTSGDKGAHTVEVVANGDGVYFKNSSVTVNINASHTSLCLAPITEYKLEDGVLSWAPVGGTKGYLVVDLDRSGTRITDTNYAIEGALGFKNLVYGVYPISDSSLISDAEITAVDIPYLKGKGTESEPYLISTPFELRAIDYYEAIYAEKLTAYNNREIATAPTKNVYRIEKDIDYATVAAADDASNIFTLSKPFYGTLDGNGKTIKGMRVHYNGGYWAMFDYLVGGSTVKNLTFDEPTINNEFQDVAHPINASIATVAYNNYGTVSNIKVQNVSYTAAGGEISGIVSHNYGVVEGCTVSGMFKLEFTGYKGQGCYETAGIVLENYGTVRNNNVTTLTIDGDCAESADTEGYFYNIGRCVGGIVAVNRAGGIVQNNGYTTLKMSGMNNNYVDENGGHEFGGIVAYNAGTVIKGSAAIGTFTWGTSTDSNGKKLASPTSTTILRDIDNTRADLRGKIVGKNDGTIT